MSTGTINQKAIDLLDQAAFTSSAVKDKERTSGSVKDENLYPKTREEALQMKDLLSQAWDAAEDREEAEFKEKYERLSEVVDWSLTRHKTWKWPVIAGAALFAALLFWGYTAQLKEVKGIKDEIKQVKAWEPVRDTTITWEECGTEYSGTDYYKDATTWKVNRLALLKSSYQRYSKSAAEYKAKADTASVKKERKYFLEHEKKYSKDAAEKRKEFDELSDAKFKDVQKQVFFPMDVALQTSSSSSSCLWWPSSASTSGPAIPTAITSPNPAPATKYLAGYRRWASGSPDCASAPA